MTLVAPRIVNSVSSVTRINLNQEEVGSLVNQKFLNKFDQICKSGLSVVKIEVIPINSSY